MRHEAQWFASMKRVLMVAFHFPPVAEGSGHLRTLGFVRHLPALGWEPIVLSANVAAYPRVQIANNHLIPNGCNVYRALAFDARRHLAINGKYPGFLAQPDGWASWWFAAVAKGLLLIRRQRIDAIWSTYPIMTAHCIAHTLCRATGLPWLADFRDPVNSSVESANRFSVASQKRCESRVLSRACHVVFTTAGAMRSYAARFPEAAETGRLSVIPNGYEESDFANITNVPAREPGQPLRLLHSGVLHREGRDPIPFFAALARLKAAGVVTEKNLQVTLRASGDDDHYESVLRRLGLRSIVMLALPISNRDALQEQALADGLLLFQGRQFDYQIPAKVYEYIRARRPIFALVNATGDTASLLREVHAATVAPIDDIAAIENGLAQFIEALRERRAPVLDARRARQYSRLEGSMMLAELLDRYENNKAA